MQDMNSVWGFLFLSYIGGVETEFSMVVNKELMKIHNLQKMEKYG